jgi:hypothetical protein
MQKPPYTFQAITHFSVVKVETCHPKLKGIKTLTLEIESKILTGKCRLILVKPFPPFARPGEELEMLASIRAGDIESVWAYRKPDDGQPARIEIRGKFSGAPVFVKCDDIEGVPGWDEAMP